MPLMHAYLMCSFISIRFGMSRGYVDSQRQVPLWHSTRAGGYHEVLPISLEVYSAGWVDVVLYYILEVFIPSLCSSFHDFRSPARSRFKLMFVTWPHGFGVTRSEDCCSSVLFVIWQVFYSLFGSLISLNVHPHPLNKFEVIP
jgi:hypothetical protein